MRFLKKYLTYYISFGICVILAASQDWSLYQLVVSFLLMTSAFTLIDIKEEVSE